MSLCGHRMSYQYQNPPELNSQLFSFAPHPAHACLGFNLVCLVRELRQAAGAGGRRLPLQPPLLALPAARGRGGPAHRAHTGGGGRGPVHRGQPPHVPALRPGPGHRPSDLHTLATPAPAPRGCGRGGGGAEPCESDSR